MVDVDQNFSPVAGSGSGLDFGLVRPDSDELVDWQRVEELVGHEEGEAIARDFRNVLVPGHLGAIFGDR